MTENTLKSPVGDIVYMALARKTKQQGKTDPVFLMRLLIDGNTEEGKAFRDAVTQINDRIVVTTGCEAGWFKVTAKTKFDVSVIGPDGELMEQVETPTFTPGSSGRASMLISSKQRDQGGSIYLKGVVLNSLDIAPVSEEYQAGNGGDSSDIEQLKQMYREALENE